MSTPDNHDNHDTPDWSRLGTYSDNVDPDARRAGLLGFVSLSCCFCLFPLGLVAVFFGVRSLSRGRPTGQLEAWLGILLGGVSVVVGGVSVGVSLLTPRAHTPLPPPPMLTEEARVQIEDATVLAGAPLMRADDALRARDVATAEAHLAEANALLAPLSRAGWGNEPLVLAALDQWRARAQLAALLRDYAAATDALQRGQTPYARMQLNGLLQQLTAYEAAHPDVAARTDLAGLRAEISAALAALPAP